MKKLGVFAIMFLFCVISFWSCKTDFSINGDYKITPIVYGLLDQNESYHYFRINKTFLGDGNALDFAKVSDSSYFESVEAKISEIINGSVTRTWMLRDTILHNKSTNGVFYAPDQKLFYFMTPPDAPNYPTVPNPDRLQEGATYKLEAILNDGAYKVTASTELVTGVKLDPPTNFSFYNENSAEPFKNPVIEWSLGNAQIYNATLNFYYKEYIGGTPTSKSVNWQLQEISRKDIAGSNASVSAQGKQFYNIVAAQVKENASVDKRVIDYFEVVLTAGSQDVETYILANKPSSSLAQSKPSFTNIDGGMGMFSARTTIKKRIYFIDSIIPCNRRGMDQRSTRYLCNGPTTGLLKFCSNNPQDGGSTCPGFPLQSFYCN